MWTEQVTFTKHLCLFHLLLHAFKIETKLFVTNCVRVCIDQKKRKYGCGFKYCNFAFATLLHFLSFDSVALSEVLMCPMTVLFFDVATQLIY